MKIKAILFLMMLILSLITITLQVSITSATPTTQVSIVNPLTGNNTFTFYTNTVDVGYSFKVKFIISDVTNLALWQVSVHFNPVHIECLNISIPENNIFAGKVIIAPDPLINNELGNVVYGATIFPMVGVSGSGTLCEAWFKIKTPPPPGQILTSTIQLVMEDTFITKLEDPQGNLIPFTPQHAIYKYVSTEQPVIPKIYVEPARIIDAELTPCKNFTVNINVQNVYQLNSVSFKLEYNVTIIFIQEVVLGPFFPSNTYWLSQVDNENGFASFYALIQPPSTPLSGSGSLATITFHVVGTGHTNLTLSETSLLDPESNPIIHNVQNGYFNNMLIGKFAVDPAEIISPELVPPKTFQINITISDVENLYAYEFILRYDPRILSCVGVIFQDALGETYYIPQFSVNNTEGLLWVSVKYYAPAEPITTYSPTTLLTVIFRVRGFGATPLDLQDTSMWDHEGNPIIHEALDGFFMAVIRDIAITNVVAWPTKVYAGRSVYINITILNKGDLAETFDVTAYFDGNVIDTLTIENLPSGQEITVTVTWDTKELNPCSSFTISAKAGPVPYEMDIEDNTFVDGTIKIKILGDINGDGIVDMTDVGILIRTFGATPTNPRWDSEADLNFDNKIDMTDIGIVLRNYNRKC